MDVKSFYKRKRKEEREENRSSTSALPRCKKLQQPKRQLDPDTVWRVFPRQQMAFDFAKMCWQSVAVFAFESEEFGNQGQRKYLVTTYHRFARQYLAMPPPRYFYEVITEGAVCRLYFDIEYNLEMNPSTVSISVLETFIEYVFYQLSVCFKLSCSRNHVLDLDSSTETKFSRHLVFHLPDTVFTNNLHAGSWVHYICDQLRTLQRISEGGKDLPDAWRTIFSPNTPSCPPAEQLIMLFVATERGGTTLICDEGVYTRNRNFRLFLSSKLGKKHCLKLARENTFRPGRKARSRKTQLVQLFMDTLICNVSYETVPRVLSFEYLASGQMRSCHQSSHSPDTGGPSARSREEGYSSSPYPLVDAFITSCVSMGGIQGAIRRWSYFQQEKLLVYDIKNNRWCENIQRAHKSNNIMIIADLQRGVYYQKCHDPTCRSINFKSNECPIPTNVYPGGTRPSSGGPNETSDSVSGDWLRGVALEDVEDYSLDNVESGGLGDCGVGLDDEAILDRVASEMDFDFPDESYSSKDSGTGDPHEFPPTESLNSYEDALYSRLA